MLRTAFILFTLSFFSCDFANNQKTSSLLETSVLKASIDSVLDAYHQAAAVANYEDFFNLMSPEAVFIGTDATEIWNKAAFQTYAKPHFDKGKAWHFTPIERHIYTNETQSTVWFDELLQTQMKICRGSGVLVRHAPNEWKIAHYVLSATIPNSQMKAVIQLKSAEEDSLIRSLTLPQ